jgi:hypothetical protein
MPKGTRNASGLCTRIAASFPKAYSTVTKTPNGRIKPINASKTARIQAQNTDFQLREIGMPYGGWTLPNPIGPMPIFINKE